MDILLGSELVGSEKALSGEAGAERRNRAGSPRRAGVLMRGRPNRLRMAIRRPGACLSLLFLMALVAAAVFAPWLTPYATQGAGAPDIAHRLLAPSSAHLLGTDEMGRDMLVRVLYGARTSLALAALVVGSSVVVGIVMGLAAGYAGGWVDEAAMRTTDVFLAFPPLLLAILLITVLGGGFASTMLALALVWWPVYAVLVRGQVVSVRSRPFVEAARATGVPPLGIMRRHLLPNAVGPLLVQATVDVGAVILVAAGLSFIGLGPQPPTADWGMMINSGRQYVLGGSWWVAGVPGIAILLTALAFAVLGDYLRDAGDPHRHRL